MAKSGELKEIWDVAARTNLQFNMVGIFFFELPLRCLLTHREDTACLSQRVDPLNYQALHWLCAWQITFMTCCLLLTIVASVYVFTRSKPVYLLDYHCYKPPDE